MGLDISLIKIKKEITNNTNWLAVEDCPELKQKFADFAMEKDDNFDGCEKKSIPVYYYEEIAYQRKGVKKSFYDRYESDVFIQSKKDLDELKNYILDEYLSKFKKDFIEKFKEDENLIMIGY